MTGLFGRSGLFWLLGFEARLQYRTWYKSAAKNLWVAIGVFATAGLGLLGLGFLAAMGLATIDQSAAGNDTAILIVSAIMAFIATLMVSQAILGVTSAIYTRGDLDLLFSSPLSPWVIAASRAIAIALNVATLFLILVAAVLVWTPLTKAWHWLSLAPAIFALALLATAIGLVVADGLFRLIGPRSTRLFVQVFGALTGAGVFVLAQVFNLLSDDRQTAIIEPASAWLQSTHVHVQSPVWLPARAALGDPIALLVWVASAVAIFALAAFYFSRKLVRNANEAALTPKRIDTRKIAPMKSGGLIASLVRKEWRLLRRDPLLLSRIGTQSVYLLPLIVAIGAGAARGGDAAGIVNAMYAGAFVLLASTIAASLAWVTASAEDAPELILAAPILRREVETGKLLAAAVPIIAVMILPAAFIGLTAPIDGLIVFAGVVCAAVTGALIGVWYQKPANRREFRKQRPTSWVAGIGQMLTAFGWTATTGMALSPLGWWALIPLVFTLGALLLLEDSRPRTHTLA